VDTTGESTLSIVLDLVALIAGLQVAARLWPVNRRLPIVAVVSTLAVAWNAPGGGSSFASDALLLSMCALGALTLRRPLILGSAGIAAAAGIVLVAANDAHGVAMLLGAVLGLGFGYARRLSPARTIETKDGARA
jgi:hypothetical protein